MTDGLADIGGADIRGPRDNSRLILFAIHSTRGEVDDASRHQLAELRPLASRLVVIVEKGIDAAEAAALSGMSDRVLWFDGRATDARAYRRALQDEFVEGYAEVVLTGNGWFGPIGSFDHVLERMAARDLDAWRLIETADRDPEVFPQEGFPRARAPWIWTVARRETTRTAAWREYWAVERSDDEEDFNDHLVVNGLRTEAAFPAGLGPRGNPGILAPAALLRAGCPVLLRAVFAQFPPLLDRFAVLVRPILEDIERRGYPVAHLWRAVARTTPPAALNALAGMVEVLGDGDAPILGEQESPGRTPLRVCVIVHVPHLDFVDELAGRLTKVPGPFDLVVTTTDGRKAAKLRSRLSKSTHEWARRAVVRVTWVPGGRDIGALLIGCKDILLSDRYDLLIRLHGRELRRKPLNVREYARRYQLENLLSSPGYVERVFDLFRREPGLGMVFPPLIHIGYGIMGRGWGAYREPAEKLGSALGVRVPLDEVSPLAPYGGMWIGRPEALRAFAAHEWKVGDYHRNRRSQWVELTRVQERLLCLAAAESGYHCRTILNAEHAAIAYTALEYKLDELSSNTRGYPVEQIHLLRRAGWTGYGSIVALSRMYVNLNHPRIASVAQPAYRLLRNAALLAKRLVSAARNEHVDDGRQ